MSVTKTPSFNILLGLIAKVASIAVAIFSVPLLLSLLNEGVYGTWVTLTSLIAFISLLDIGAGYSIRNSVASLTASTKETVVDEVVSFIHLLFFIGFLSAIIFSIYVFIFDPVPGQKLATFFLYLPLLLFLPSLLGSSILQGAQSTGIQSILQTISSLGFFLFVFSASYFSLKLSLVYLAIAWSFFYLLSNFLISYFGLRTLHVSFRRIFKPSFSYVPGNRLKVGAEFLFLQLSALVLYGLGNVIIYAKLGSIDAARYDVLNKIFQVGLSLYFIVVGVYWAEISKCRSIGDVKSMNSIFKRLWMLSIFFSIGCFSVAFFAPYIIDLWTGHRLKIDLFEAMASAFLAAVQSMAYVGAVYMNAFEVVRLQIMLAFFSIAAMLPLAFMFIDLNFGIASVSMAGGLLTVIPMLVCNYIALRLIRGIHV